MAPANTSPQPSEGRRGLAGRAWRHHRRDAVLADRGPRRRRPSAGGGGAVPRPAARSRRSASSTPGRVSVMLEPTQSPVNAARTSATLARSSGQPGFCCTVLHQIAPGAQRIREIPASADVAQLVEHFTRNEELPGFDRSVGSPRGPEEIPEMEVLSLARTLARGLRKSRRWTAPTLWLLPRCS